jgi:DNA-binding MarR family transcriptional regulator
LRLVSRKGATTPAELAADLGLSRSLVSELVRKLEETDLITRTKSATDGRSVTLSPSERGAYVQRHYRLGLFDAFSEALGALPHAEARLILAALPALDSLRRQMETIAGREEEAAKASTM